MGRRLIPLVFAGLIMALVAGCADDGNSSEAETDYAQEMQDIQQDPGGKTAELGAAMVNPRLGSERWRRAADLWLGEQHRALQRLRETTPPSDVATLHVRYVAKTGDWLFAMEQLVRSVQRGEIPRDELERRATKLGDGYAQQAGPVASEIEAKGYDAFQPFDSPH